MILVADSGSTKTDWGVAGTKDHVSFKTEGFNPYFSSTERIIEVLRQQMPALILPGDISNVYFYGSGCFPDKIHIVSEALAVLFPKAKVDVQLDLLGTARALLRKSVGLACILGTGTNSCLFDGTRITMNIDSLGYILGDEGSGTHIGKRLLSDFLRGYMPASVQQMFTDQYRLTIEEAFDRIYGKPMANTYCAFFVPFLSLPGIDQAYRRSILESSFTAFFEQLVIHYPNYSSYSFNCSGSVAFVFADILKEVATHYGMTIGKIIRQPMDGLLEYHSND